MMGNASKSTSNVEEDASDRITRDHRTTERDHRTTDGVLDDHGTTDGDLDDLGKGPLDHGGDHGPREGYLENRSRYRRPIKTTTIVAKIVTFLDLMTSTKLGRKRFKIGLEDHGTTMGTTRDLGRFGWRSKCSITADWPDSPTTTLG